MATTTRMGTEELMARELNRRLYELAVAVADQNGAPPQSSSVSEDREFRLWMQMDPNVDVLALIQQGMSPEEATLKKYPFRGPLLVQGKPKLVQRVAYANRMAKREEKMRAEQNAQLPPEPQTPYLDHAARNAPETDLAHPYFVTPEGPPSYMRALHHKEDLPPMELPKNEG